MPQRLPLNRISSNPIELPPQRVAVVYTTVGDHANGDEREAADLTETAFAVAQTLGAAGHAAEPIAFGHDLLQLGRTLRAYQPAVVFNLAERPLDRNDKEPHVAAFLELLSLPYTGNGPDALTLCKNKAVAKQLLLAHGLPTPRFQVYAQAFRFTPELAFPLMVKPLTEDGSLGIAPESIVESSRALQRRVSFLRERYRQDAIVEEFLPGREFSVTVLGNGSASEPYRAFPPGELVYHSPEWRVCTFEAKWQEDHPSFAAVEAQYPARIGATLRRALEKHALAAARLFEIRGYARIDFRMNHDDVPCVLEVNPNPDISPGSGMSRTVATAGLDYPRFLQEVMRLGLAGGAR